VKFDRILFPVDFSEDNRALARQVTWLANRFDSRVTLLNVSETTNPCYTAAEAYYDWGTYTALTDRAKDQLHEFPIDLPKERVERTVVEGQAAYQIVSWANEHKTDLIVMGTHHCGTFRGLLLGSVAAEVVHDVSCPVWVYSTLHHPMDTQSPAVRTIICAVELTREALPLLRFTSELAKKLGAKVIVVHSVSESEIRPNKYFDMDLHESLMHEARMDILKLQLTLETDYPVQVTREGISKTIADVAREQHADLAIIGRGKCRQMLGSLRTHTYEIIRETQCPVLSYTCTSTEEERVPSPAEHGYEELTGRSLRLPTQGLKSNCQQ
jgi:nucleotide-binding universal stress UspA family protein